MKFKKWELAFIFALVVALFGGTAAAKGQSALADKLVRLHVVANSDSEADQGLKMRVRDAIIECLTPKLAGITDAAEAQGVISDSFAEIRAAAMEEIRGSGYEYDVTVSLRNEDFPTRRYDTFSLPAGEYNALRVEIGDAAGQNWWCVLFPPICTEVAIGTVDIDDSLGGLTEGEVRLIHEEDGYVIGFKTMEILAKLKIFLLK